MENKTTNNNVSVNRVMISEDYANNLINDISTLQDEVSNVAKHNAVLISLKVCEALEQKVHWLKGYEDNTKGQCQFLEDYFSYEDKKWGDTQRKMANLIAHNFGRRIQGSTAYEVVSPSVLLYGEANLWEISKFEGFDKDNFDKFVESKGITPTTSKAELKRMRTGIEENKDDKDNKDSKENREAKDTKDNAGEDNTLTVLKTENDNLHAKVDNIRDDLSKLYQLALDKKTDDKKFRDEAKKTLAHLEKSFK